MPQKLCEGPRDLSYSVRAEDATLRQATIIGIPERISNLLANIGTLLGEWSPRQ